MTMLWPRWGVLWTLIAYCVLNSCIALRLPNNRPLSSCLQHKSFRLRSSYLSEIYIGDKLSYDDPLKKEEILKLIDCLTSPSDMNDDDYDYLKEERRRKLLRENDFSALRRECERRGLPKSFQKRDMLLALLLHKLDPSIKLERQLNEETPTMKVLDLNNFNSTLNSSSLNPNNPITVHSEEDAYIRRKRPRTFDADDVQFLSPQDPLRKLKRLPVLQDGVDRSLLVCPFRSLLTSSGVSSPEEVRLYSIKPRLSLSALSPFQTVTFVVGDCDFRQRGIRVLCDELALSTMHQVVLIDLPVFNTALTKSQKYRVFDALYSAITAVKLEFSPQTFQFVGFGSAGGALLDFVTEVQSAQFSLLWTQIAQTLGIETEREIKKEIELHREQREEIEEIIRRSKVFPFQIEEIAETEREGDEERKEIEKSGIEEGFNLSLSLTPDLSLSEEEESALINDVFDAQRDKDRETDAETDTDTDTEIEGELFVHRFRRLLNSKRAKTERQTSLFQQRQREAQKPADTEREGLQRLLYRLRSVFDIRETERQRERQRRGRDTEREIQRDTERDRVLSSLCPSSLVVVAPSDYDRDKVQETLTVPLHLTLTETDRETERREGGGRRQRRAEVLSWMVATEKRRDEIWDFSLSVLSDTDGVSLCRFMREQSPVWVSLFEEREDETRMNAGYREERTERERRQRETETRETEKEKTKREGTEMTLVTDTESGREKQTERETERETEAEVERETRYLSHVRRRWLTDVSVFLDLFVPSVESKERTFIAGQIKETVNALRRITPEGVAVVEDRDRDRERRKRESDGWGFKWSERDLDRLRERDRAVSVGGHLHFSSRQLSVLSATDPVPVSILTETERQEKRREIATTIERDEAEEPQDRPLWR